MVSNPTTMQRLTDAADRIEAYNALEDEFFVLVDEVHAIWGKKVLIIDALYYAYCDPKTVDLAGRFYASMKSVLLAAKSLGEYTRDAGLTEEEWKLVDVMIDKRKRDRAKVAKAKKAAARKKAKATAPSKNGPVQKVKPAEMKTLRTADEIIAEAEALRKQAQAQSALEVPN